MQIRPATKADADACCAIYDAARAFMHANGNPDQWPDEGRDPYPGRREVRRDTFRGTLFVCEDADGEVVGCFDFESGPDPDYNVIDGAWLNKFPYFVVHRIAARRQGEGIGGAMLDWVVTAANNVRVDTHADNVPMQRLLESRGFERCGIVCLRRVGERVAYHFQRPDDRLPLMEDKPFWAWMR